MPLQNGAAVARKSDGNGTPSATWIDLACTFPFLVLYWVDLWHHVLWFDEINAWSIVAGSPSLHRLNYFVHVEAHPWLWYYVLYLPSRLTHNPDAMKCVEGLIGTAIYLIIGLLSPFTRTQKLLIFASYYVVFEYTVMSRMYGLMLLFALLYVWRRLRNPSGVVGNLVLLGMMANVDLTGVLLSGSLLLQYAFDLWTDRRASGWTRQQLRMAGLAVFAYLALLAVSIHSLLPSPDISWEASGHIGSGALTPRRIVQSLGNMIASPWWPISRDFPHRFWATDAIRNKKLLLLVPFVLFAYQRIFRGNRSLQLLVWLTLGFGIFFADVVYSGRVRHWGIAFVAFLIALWMQAVQTNPETGRATSRWSPWAYALMAIAALAGATATVGSWLHPFSQSRAAADWIRTNEPPNVPLIGERDLNLASLTEQLQRPAYFMECGCSDTMKLFTHDRDSFKPAELPSRILLAMHNLSAPELVMVDNRALPADIQESLRQASLQVSPLAKFEGAEDDFESFYLYKITQLPTSAVTPHP